MTLAQMKIIPAVAQLDIPGQPEVTVSPWYELNGGTVRKVPPTDL